MNILDNLKSLTVPLKPVAVIRNGFSEKFGIPRQSGRVNSLTSDIVFLPEYRNPDALREIEGFSHLWLLFYFSQSHRDDPSLTVRPPRLGGNTRVGVFASRSPFRPNPIGLSCVKLSGLEKTENEGIILKVNGADLLDGTPIFDIKPYIPFSDCHPEAKGGYSDRFKEYKLNVIISDELKQLVPADKLLPLTECIADDPRPSYHDDADRVYHMLFSGFDIGFSVNKDTAVITSVSRIDRF